MILPYHGTGIAEVGTRTVEIGAHGSDTITMSGWFVANGLAGTPDLDGNKFLRGGVSSGGFGGSNDAVVVEHTHGITDPTHTHKTRLGGGPGSQVGLVPSGSFLNNAFHIVDNEAKATGISIDSEGVSGVGLNQPEYMNVIWIIRMS